MDSITTFPSHVKFNPHPGYRYDNDPGIKALFKASMGWPKTENGFMQGLLQWGMTQPSAIVNNRLDIGALSRRHITVFNHLPADGADPFDAELYALILSWVEDNGYLSTPLQDQPPEKILRLLKTVASNCVHPCHRVANAVSKGALRKQDVMVSNSQHFLGFLPQDVLPYLEANDSALVPGYREFVGEFQKTGQLKTAKFSEQAQAFLKKYAFVAPPWQDVESLMDQFILNLVARLQDPENDAIDTAAWAHMQLVKIHPWGDANGRTARTLLWTILLQAGHQPFEIRDNKSYTTAVHTDSGNGEIFGQYLRDNLEVSTTTPVATAAATQATSWFSFCTIC